MPKNFTRNVYLQSLICLRGRDTAGGTAGGYRLVGAGTQQAVQPVATGGGGRDTAGGTAGGYRRWGPGHSRRYSPWLQAVGAGTQQAVQPLATGWWGPRVKSKAIPLTGRGGL
jgi:hypothetical protein